MGMLLHNTLMEREKENQRETKVVKPVEIPVEEQKSEPVNKTGGRRKTK